MLILKITCFKSKLLKYFNKENKVEGKAGDGVKLTKQISESNYLINAWNMESIYMKPFLLLYM